MTSYLLDTNVVSESSKRTPNLHVLSWLAATPAAAKFVSAVTLGELWRGVERLAIQHDPRSDGFSRWFAEVAGAFGRRVLPVDRAVAERWGSLTARGTLPAVDALLAATASVHGLTLATRNVRHFAGAGVPVVNPFDSQ